MLYRPSLLPSGWTAGHAHGSRPRLRSAPSTPSCSHSPSAVAGGRLPQARDPTAPTSPADFPHGSRPLLQIASRVRSDRSPAQNTSPSCLCPPWSRRTGSTEIEKFPRPFPTATGNRPGLRTQISASPEELPALLPQPSLPPRSALHSTLRSHREG